MPELDRVITVRIATGGRNNYGEYVETVAESRAWATRTDQSLEDIEEAGGERNEATRTYMVRWTSALAQAPASAVSIVDDDLVFNVLNLIEASGPRVDRRRFITIEAVAEVTA